MVGYMVSPLLSDMRGMSLSAGRVQSPAVRLVVERERRIKAFKKTNHFGAVVFFDSDSWSAEWNTKPFTTKEAPYVLNEELANRASNCRQFKVTNSETGTAKKAPPSPFSTSLLLQAASVSLKLDPEVTAKLAQKLFEQGVITYIRTDSVNFSDEAIAKIRGFAQGKGWAYRTSRAASRRRAMHRNRTKPSGQPISKSKKPARMKRSARCIASSGNGRWQRNWPI